MDPLLRHDSQRNNHTQQRTPVLQSVRLWKNVGFGWQFYFSGPKIQNEFGLNNLLKNVIFVLGQNFETWTSGWEVWEETAQRCEPQISHFFWRNGLILHWNHLERTCFHWSHWKSITSSCWALNETEIKLKAIDSRLNSFHFSAEILDGYLQQVLSHALSLVTKLAAKIVRQHSLRQGKFSKETWQKPSRNFQHSQDCWCRFNNCTNWLWQQEPRKQEREEFCKRIRENSWAFATDPFLSMWLWLLHWLCDWNADAPFGRRQQTVKQNPDKSHGYYC